MRSLCLTTVALLCFALTACGGGGNSSSTPSAPQSLTLTSGNWDFAAASSTGASFIIGGNITQTGNTIAGGVRVINSVCIATTTAVPITGSINSQTATITSANINSQTITATLTGSSTALNGTYSVSGVGCVGGDKGTFSGVLVPSISGTWKGTFISAAAGNPQVGVTAPIAQGSANADGTFPLTGTLAYDGSPCFNTGGVGVGVMFGRLVDIFVLNNDGSIVEFIGTVANPASPSQITGTYGVAGGACDGDTGTGTLTK